MTVSFHVLVSRHASISSTMQLLQNEVADVELLTLYNALMNSHCKLIASILAICSLNKHTAKCIIACKTSYLLVLNSSVFNPRLPTIELRDKSLPFL